ncbi:oxidoreductase [Dyadobacter subterraneus]|uniref:SDR family NAD(P)-dependent oxidoreductase n=1 Tax=Dyadobacter subterraneus TaxID=2773304 RepID=A0ABR9W7A7_9BACT|nr:oxidoreductase [Dyadobacter subterraneus]MBE9461345.1 SDR family NAD(P)-dependent oxidoreductase [Dyadobacter subterraneus]
MEGKVVLITGASSGMGKATAELLSASGYKVYGAARRTELMRNLKEVGIKILQMDVTDDISIQKGIDEIIKKEGKIDILINNAGFGLFGSIEDVPMDEARYQMDVNVFGLARLTQLVLPYMRKQNSGKIVNITSTGGKLSSPLGGWYHASKYAVEALSDSLRMEVKQFGIDVIVIEPGAIKSEWGDIAMENLRKISAGKAYSPLAGKIIEMSQKLKPKNEDPEVIAKLILKSISTRNPRTRYHAGYLSGIILFLKKVLTDKQFDKLMLSQMK